MISEKCFSKDWIEQQRRRYPKADPLLIERFIHAFELLGRIAKTGEPFIFRGGTSVVLRIPDLRRLSIDVDIVGHLTLAKVQEALKGSVFTQVQEDVRKPTTIPKSHFKAEYRSHYTKDSVYVLLDVFGVDDLYAATEHKRIENNLFECDNETTVLVPGLDSLLADKLTAFAPSTIGIRFGTGKAMEIAKQIFDIGELFGLHSNPGEMLTSYERIVAIQNRAQSTQFTLENVLDDTIRAAFLIAQLDLKGSVENDETNELRSGLKQVKSHLLNARFSFVEAKVAASRGALLAGLLRYGRGSWKPDEIRFEGSKLDQVKSFELKRGLSILNRLKATNPQAFYCWMILSEISSNLKETKLL